jgi:hypothetical protein
MASPQIENGYVATAHDLYVAIDRAGWSMWQRRVVSAVMYFTYGNGKTKTELSAEDIRYYLGAPKTLRAAYVESEVQKLITARVLFRQVLANGKQILGLQKDYDLWALMVNGTLQGLSSSVLKEDPVRQVVLTVNAPERLLDYVQEKCGFKYSIPKWRVERKFAKNLYVETLMRTKNADEAYQLITDFIDQDEWMQANVRMQFTYMSSRFEAWRVQIPRKPKQIREDEEALGRRYRYNVKTKTWEAKIQ